MHIHSKNLNSAVASRPGRSGLVALSSFFAQGFRRWQKRRVIETLQQLSDRQLEDIGIARNEIPRVAEGLFARAGDSRHASSGSSGPVR
ncbi:DUF1127 domain-containing protein [Aureimonas glaciei]|uniref:DUF1127 domain-containing protein n=1 Tax=Aureimonas glaciei TaxID=1776957 RepID=UPI001667A32F|nr:DUF1127 domain-containing protein [Aureimonas glaciei]